MRRLSFLAVALLAFVSCSGDDGGESSTDTTATESSAPADGTDTDMDTDLELTSPAFGDGEAIPPDHAACVGGTEGPDMSPPLAWDGVPDEADQLAVTLVDPDADGFVHWVIAGIDPSSDGLAAEEVPAGAVEALNDTGAADYFGPCPPEAHTYVFTLHVLDEDPGVDGSTPRVDAVAAVEAASSASAELTGTYDQDG
jgi:Raf kinase inhibitor-like YbhB/YbcL family protein